MTQPVPKLEDFPVRSFDKIRRGEAVDNHVNNIQHPGFCDTGRTDITHQPELIAMMAGKMWFAAHFSIDYHAELYWPGIVDIGTGIKALGRSSATFVQGLFQNGICAATSETVMVQVDTQTRRPAPFSEATRAWLLRSEMKP